MRIMKTSVQPVQFGNGITDVLSSITGGITNFFTPKEGTVVVTPGIPAAFSWTVAGTLAAAVILVAVLKKEKVI